jgi:hypothetical protein
MLNRDQILNAKDLRTEPVAVPEWGGEVAVRMLTGTERDAFEASLFVGEGQERRQDMANVRAKLIARTVVGDDGKLVFTEADIAALGEKSAAALDRVFTVAQRINGLGAKDVADLAGNSAPGLSGSSTSV